MTIRRAMATFLAAAILAAALAACGDDSSTATTAEVGEAQIVSPSELSDAAAESANGIYWLGAREGASYELTRSPSGRIYIRYLDGGAEAGASSARFITVGTYPTAADPTAELRKAARGQPGSKLQRTKDGALLLVDPSSPDNAHLVPAGAGVQVEVYSPVPGEALRLAAKGRVQPVP